MYMYKQQLPTLYKQSIDIIVWLRKEPIHVCEIQTLDRWFTHWHIKDIELKTFHE